MRGRTYEWALAIQQSFSAGRKGWLVLVFNVKIGYRNKHRSVVRSKALATAAKSHQRVGMVRQVAREI
eukprot:scaffold5337_cov167-Amphora_coffeaeformis.AAC.7